jgi:hypothetical protein
MKRYLLHRLHRLHWLLGLGASTALLSSIGGRQAATQNRDRLSQARPPAVEAPGTAEPAPPPGGPLVEALGGIDFVPERERLEAQLDNPLEKLIQVTRPSEQTIDPGVRLRALQALASYPSGQTERVLGEAIAAHDEARDGVELLYLRAAISSYARIAGARAVAAITPLLDHASRDVRADAAHALALTRAPVAIPGLRQRRRVERTPQVISALDAAIRTINTAGN